MDLENAYDNVDNLTKIGLNRVYEPDSMYMQIKVVMQYLSLQRCLKYTSKKHSITEEEK